MNNRFKYFAPDPMPDIPTNLSEPFTIITTAERVAQRSKDREELQQRKNEFINYICDLKNVSPIVKTTILQKFLSIVDV